MNYYLARECLYPLPQKGDTIGFDRTAAESWDVKYIMKTTSTVPYDLLYMEEDGSAFYLQRSDVDTFNMLDAFDIPHLNTKGYEITYSVITPQVIANKSGTRSVIVDKDTQDVKGPRRATVLPSLHRERNVQGKVMVLPIRALNFAIRIGKYILDTDNKLTEHNKK
jgi:hypothetical protein